MDLLEQSRKLRGSHKKKAKKLSISKGTKGNSERSGSSYAFKSLNRSKSTSLCLASNTNSRSSASNLGKWGNGSNNDFDGSFSVPLIEKRPSPVNGSSWCYRLPSRSSTRNQNGEKAKLCF